MKIGVVSDTHSRELPKKMLDDFRGVDLIIHAGDFCSVADFKKIQALQEVKGVYGNMDEQGIRQIFPQKEILRLGGFTIGVFHGEGAPASILEKVKARFTGDKVDCIIFGHSHRAFNEKIGEVLYFNPGSPNDPVFAPYRSYGILEIKGAQVDGTIIKLKE